MPSFVQRHMILTVLLVGWIMAIVTWVTYRVFSESPPEIAMSTVTALGTVYALPALAVALWKWRGEIISRRPKE